MNTSANDLQQIIDDFQSRLTRHDHATPAWRIQHGSTVLATSGTTGHRYRIASMTKSFTALTVLNVLHELDLNRGLTVSSVLPWVTEELSDVTVDQLLTMSAGLPTDDPWADRLEELSQADFDGLLTHPMIFNQPPGTRYEYSNFGYAILGRVVEELTGVPFPELVVEKTLQPLGLQHTGFAHDPQTDMVGYHWADDRYVPVTPTGSGAFSAIGGLWSTLEDLGLWVERLCQARQHDLAGNPTTTLAELQRPVVSYTAENRDGAGVWEAYSDGLHYRWDESLGEFIYHSGGYPGFGSHMCWHTTTGLGVILLGNTTYFPAEQLVRPTIEALAAHYQPALPTRAKASEALTPFEPLPELISRLAALRELTGTWDEGTAHKILSPNMFQDHTRRQLQNLMGALHGLDWEQARWLSRTEVIVDHRVQVLFNPFGEIQKLTLLS